MERMNVLFGTPFEEMIGFSRAVRVGPFVSVGGTAPLAADGSTVGIGDVAAQTQRCFEIVEDALARAGASLSDVVRTRLLMVDVEEFEQAAVVRKRFVGHVKPVDTFVQVARFVNPEWLIEVEVDAIVADDGVRS